MSQNEKPDDLQSIANPIRFFCMHYACYVAMMEITQNSLAVNLTEILDKLVEQHGI